MKNIFSFILPFIVISIIIPASCGNRDSLLDNAKLNQSDIPVVLTADPSSDCPNVPANLVVSARFSEPMDTASVESAFTITVDGEAYTASGAFEWLDGNRMFIYYPPSGSLPSGSLITATIDVTAESIFGIHLSTEYVWSFTPGCDFYSGTPSILSIMPTALQAVLPTDLKIEIEFDRLMLHSTVESSFLLVSDSANEDSRTSNNGSFTWENTVSGEKVSYMPDEAPGNNNTYTLYLNNRGITCRDLSGNALTNFQTTFYTADTAIYVSNDDGNDANKGFHKSVPVQTIGKALENAVLYGIALIKVEGEGPNTTYIGQFSIPSGITIEGGWNRSFNEKNRSTYSTSINSGSSQHTFILSGVSGCTLDSLSIWGGESTGTEDTAVFIKNSSNISVQYCNILGPNQSAATQGLGIKIENSSDVILDSNDGISGGSTPYNAGVYVLGSSKNITIKNNKKIIGITGGATGISYGILLGNGTGPIAIENNNQISGNSTSNSVTFGIYIRPNAVATIRGNNIDGGSTTNNPTYGIYVDTGADVEISDNAPISGGTTSNGDTYGIFIGSSADVRMFRNTIEGGKESTSTIHTNYGLFVDSASACSIFNNFISGSSISTNNSNISHSIHAKDTTIYVINNTIDGGGTTGGINSSTGLYIEDSTGWSIDPIIINNIMNGGKNNSKYGIYFVNDSQVPPLACTINNNTFRGEGTYIDGSNSFTGISFPTAPITTSEVTVATENLFYNIGPPADLAFINDATVDYHISTTSSDTSSIKDNGYDVSTLSLDPSLLNELLIDIDGTTRNPASIDRGAHEFNP